MTPHNYPKAKQVLDALIHGVDPDTGEELPSDAVSNRPDVLRALLTADVALDTVQARAQRRAQLPPSVGKTWDPKEEIQLTKEFEKGTPIPDIAARHGRTVRAIEARLVKLGLVPEDLRTATYSFAGTAAAKGDGE